MLRPRWPLALTVTFAALACGSHDGTGPKPPVPQPILGIVSGNEQQGLPSNPLAASLIVQLADSAGNPVGGGDTVVWRVASGGGALGQDTTLTAANGQASVQWTLGPDVGGNSAWAVWPGHDSVGFHATATGAFAALGGGNNVPDRYTSDLWVADGYGYSGTWGNRGTLGNAVKVWRLDAGGAPTLTDSIITPGIAYVSDIQVSPDGKWLVFTAEGGGASGNPGIHAYELVAPGQPVFRAKSVVANGLHTGTLAEIGGKLYAFTAKDPPSCALLVFDLSGAAAGTIAQASSTPIPDHYCIHDTFVRDGYAFVLAWDEGLYIFDVGNGSHGGSPTNPVQISHTGSQAQPAFGGHTHNGWWFWNPVTGEKKYLFIGSEGAGVVGASSSGDIHVVDVSDFAHPTEVASFHLPGAGTHNFWMDEPAQRLYAAYYNGGVVALDVSGTLSGDLSSRLIANLQPGGAGDTYTWGVMLYNGSLYASDMLSGFWQLQVP